MININVNKADRLIEGLEILASDNYYPIEDSPKYEKLCEMVEEAEFNSSNYIDKEYFMEIYLSLRKDIENY